MYLVKRNDRIVERTTSEQMARTLAEIASAEDMIQIVEDWDYAEGKTVAWYLGGHEV